ncbi:hypothetical protein IPM09_01070 [Candidatus Saccharibacteria bacterium]|nr:MAG: hypothetical protein IPM09_01070 [Candidatus Saccharibacteria bacterium]
MLHWLLQRKSTSDKVTNTAKSTTATAVVAIMPVYGSLNPLYGESLDDKIEYT